MQTAVVIPVHNRREVTLRCLKCLETDGVFTWASALIVDDGSTDGTADGVRARHPAVVVLAGDGNLWWGGAIRRGMEYAYREGADCVLWLNDDGLPEPGTLRLAHRRPGNRLVPDSQRRLLRGFPQNLLGIRTGATSPARRRRSLRQCRRQLCRDLTRGGGRDRPT